MAKATVKQTPNFWTQGPLWDPKKGALRRANSTRARAEAGLYFRKNFQQLTLPLRLLALDHALRSTYPVRACGFRRTDQAYYSILQYVTTSGLENVCLDHSHKSGNCGIRTRTPLGTVV